MKDRNGYAPSILDTEKGRCYICNRITDTARHEVYGGSNRKNSKKCGTWVNLCPRCHAEVHANPNTGLDLFLKRNTQLEYEDIHFDFVQIFGRSWL